jgi:hypothetical protein
VRRIVSLVLLAVLVIGILGLSQSAVTPRAVGILTFHNDTGETARKLSIVFDKSVALTKFDFVVTGGEPVTLVAMYQTFVFIDVVVVPGGSVQLTLRGDSADAKVNSAYWYE